MPTLSEQEASSLEQPFTKEEFKVALSQLKTGKASGLDGFSAHYYKAFAKELTLYFLMVYNSFRHNPL